MTSSKKAKNVVVIKAPKLATAWNNVCVTSMKSETEVIKSVENLSATMVLESRLSVRDIQKFIKDTGKVSAFVSTSHVPALPTWSVMRAKFADFRALPLAKQLSTASASYDLLGVGKGEQFKTLDALTTEIARERKEKQTKKTTTKDTKEKKVVSVEDAIKSTIKLIKGLGDGVEDSVYDLIVELHEVTGIKVGVDA